MSRVPKLDGSSHAATPGPPNPVLSSHFTDDWTHPRLHGSRQPRPHLTIDDVYYDQSTARDLLNEAAELLREPDLTDAARRAWLARFAGLAR